MSKTSYLPEAIFEALNQEAMVITSNQRSARFLIREYDLAQKAKGLTCWSTPRIVTWKTWIIQLWRKLLIEGHATELLLNPWQEHSIWRNVLDLEDLASLKTTDTLAEIVAEAWRLLADYKGDEKLQASHGSSDAKTFQHLAKEFQRICRKRGLLSFSQLAERLCDAAEKGWLTSPARELLFVGFDSFLPSQSELIDTLRSHQWSLSIMENQNDAAEKLLVEADDETDELQIVARWISGFLKVNPDAKVAVIVPALENKKSHIECTFREILAPELHDIRLSSNAAPFEFSLGIPLLDSSIVQSAFSILRWPVAPLPLEEISSILLSPYLFDGNELPARAEFDAFELRHEILLRPEITLDQMLSILGRAKRRKQLTGVIDSLKRLSIAANRFELASGKTSYAEWASKISELLDAAGWRPRGSQSSTEFQMYMRWDEVVDAMVTLDFDGSSINYDIALRALERIARNTIFAPESRNAPVQIMGPLEAAGNKFDAVWFLTAGEFSWPLPANANPLLSWQLQRELQMPGTNIERDHAYARTITWRIAASGHTVIFSYAKHISDGMQRASFLLNEMELQQKSEELTSNNSSPPLFSLEEIEDTETVSELPDRVLRGGARVLELQAACGFRAFAEQRLWSTGLEGRQIGFDARENGIILHKAMEIFWGDVRTQDRLREMTDAQRVHTITQSIELALSKMTLHATSEWDLAYLELQKQRFYMLLEEWIKIELRRTLSFEVQQNEQEFSDARIGPLRLTVRMDRVDSVEGGQVLIDYKTGKSTPANWLTDRPKSPQLPLYAVLSADQLRGIAFAQVQRNNMSFCGFATDDEIFGKTSKMEAATLEQQIDRWRSILTMLAEQFASGMATVNPQRYPETCRLCANRLLCRLDIAKFQIHEEDKEDG